MTMLASKAAFPTSLASASASHSPNMTSAPLPPTRRAPAITTANQSFTSPTESEFSDADGSDSVKNWDEDRVCDYLRTVKCGEYEMIFRKNHINGENLLEMDKEVLKEMGIEKVGDRVRLFLGIKKLRTRAFANQKKRTRVRSPIFSPHFLLCPVMPLLISLFLYWSEEA
jgi:mitogen-activated protein kinase kinase kinase